MPQRRFLLVLAFVGPLMGWALAAGAPQAIAGAAAIVLAACFGWLAWRWSRPAAQLAVQAVASERLTPTIVAEAGKAREASVALSAIMVDMLTTAEATSERAQSVTTAAERVSGDTQTIAAGAEEMSATVREIAATTGEAARVASEAAGLATTAEAAVKRLGESSQGISTVVDAISSIAAQTNLLALNATIEAARAGDAGRGFAVVASEVKNLARQTAESTADVGRRIAAIQADTAAAVAAISAIAGRIGRINEVQQTVASAVEEQSATTQEMSRTIASTAQGASAIAKDIAGVSDDARLSAMATVAVRDLANKTVRASEAVYVVLSEQAEVKAHGVPAELFDRVIRVHLAWRMRLLAAICRKQIPERANAADHTACELGKCLVAEGARLSGHPDFAALVENHQRFHAEVGKVIDLITAKRLDEAQTELNEGGFAHASEMTIALIARLKPVGTAVNQISLAWSSEYATGVAQIDAQHKELFARVATLHSAMMSGAGRAKVVELVGFLAEYTVKHFSEEEALMVRARYADIDKHRALHRTLLEQVGGLRAKLDRGETLKTMEVTDFLAGWLRHHILKIDHAYVPAMRTAGLVA
jgi:hemerythrin-like metal-binding protein